MNLKGDEQQESSCREVSRCSMRQDGAVLVEFALVLPLLLLLLLGVLDFGRAINYWIDETQMASVGARWASVDKNPGPETLQKAIRAEADTKQLREGTGVCISFPSGTSKVGDPVEVKVTYSFTWLPFISKEALGGVTTTTLTGAATMRIEREPKEYSAAC